MASGIRLHIDEYYMYSPYDFYKMMIPDEIFQLFATEANIYTRQKKCKILRMSRIKKWNDTSHTEMEKFVGYIMWIGWD